MSLLCVCVCVRVYIDIPTIYDFRCDDFDKLYLCCGDYDDNEQMSYTGPPNMVITRCRLIMSNAGS